MVGKGNFYIGCGVRFPFQYCAIDNDVILNIYFKCQEKSFANSEFYQI
jgi:hypothetical protein